MQDSLSPALNELIFSNKNKGYGAYLLRTLYNKHLSVAIIIGTIAFTLAVASPIIYAALKPKEDIKKQQTMVIDYTLLAEPPSIDKKQEVVQVDAPPPLKSTIKFLPPIIKPDDQVQEEEIPTVEQLQEVEAGTETREGQAGGVDYSLMEVNEPTAEIVKEPEPVKEEVFTYVEEMPSFPGGNEALMTFLVQNIQYPEIAKRAGVEGRVFVSVVVKSNGQIGDAQVVKGIGAGCDEEALRVVKMMPKWAPGKQNGNSVTVRVSIPILFKLN